MSNEKSEKKLAAICCVNEYKEFEINFDIESMSYEDFFFVLVDYVESCLIHDKSNLCISHGVKNKVSLYIREVRKYLNKESDGVLLSKFCTENMVDMELAGAGRYDRVLLKIIQYSLFNRERSSLKRDGADFMLGFIFADVGLLGDEYCRKFKAYLEQHARVCKFKIP